MNFNNEPSSQRDQYYDPTSTIINDIPPHSTHCLKHSDGLDASLLRSLQTGRSRFEKLLGSNVCDGKTKNPIRGPDHLDLQAPSAEEIPRASMKTCLSPNYDSSYDSDSCVSDIGGQPGGGTAAAHSDVSRTASDTPSETLAEEQEPSACCNKRVADSGYCSNSQRFSDSLSIVDASLDANTDACSHTCTIGECYEGVEHGDPLSKVVDDGLDGEAMIPTGENIGPVLPSEVYRESDVTGEAGDNLRPIIIDGSNVAMVHGNHKLFSCRGIMEVVNWCRNRGHRKIMVFVPQWRKEASRADAPIEDQQILYDLEKEKMLVFTPSRRVGGKRIVCDDDRYIVKEAAKLGGVIISNDFYRELQKESEEFKNVIEERLLMYSFVDGRFEPPNDPLGRDGPFLDDFLAREPKRCATEDGTQVCPYLGRCTYGNKCKFFHPERGAVPSKMSPEKLAEQAALKRQQMDSTRKKKFQPSLSVGNLSQTGDSNVNNKAPVGVSNPGRGRQPLSRTKCVPAQGRGGGAASLLPSQFKPAGNQLSLPVDRIVLSPQRPQDHGDDSTGPQRSDWDETAAGPEQSGDGGILRNGPKSERNLMKQSSPQNRMAMVMNSGPSKDALTSSVSCPFTMSSSSSSSGWEEALEEFTGGHLAVAKRLSDEQIERAARENVRREGKRRDAQIFASDIILEQQHPPQQQEHQQPIESGSQHRALQRELSLRGSEDPRIEYLRRASPAQPETRRQVGMYEAPAPLILDNNLGSRKQNLQLLKSAPHLGMLQMPNNNNALHSSNNSGTVNWRFIEESRGGPFGPRHVSYPLPNNYKIRPPSNQHLSAAAALAADHQPLGRISSDPLAYNKYDGAQGEIYAAASIMENSHSIPELNAAMMNRGSIVMPHPAYDSYVAGGQGAVMLTQPPQQWYYSSPPISGGGGMPLHQGLAQAPPPLIYTTPTNLLVHQQQQMLYNLPHQSTRVPSPSHVSAASPHYPTQGSSPEPSFSPAPPTVVVNSQSRQDVYNRLMGIFDDDLTVRKVMEQHPDVTDARILCKYLVDLNR